MKSKPVRTLLPNEITRFRNNVEVRGEDECWPWRLKYRLLGYGTFSIHRNGKHLGVARAHRIAYFLHFGINPNEWCVLHRCDQRDCCNPKHLFLGTKADNIRDMNEKKRGVPPSGARNSHAKLTDAQVKEIRKSERRWGVARRLAKLYGVGDSTMCSILSGQTWKHLLP